MELSAPGPWPGSTEGLVVAPGTIAVKRKTGFFGAEEYHIIGTWTAMPHEVFAQESAVSREDVDESAAGYAK